MSAVAQSQPDPKLLNGNLYLLVQAQTVSVFGSQAYSIAMLFWVKRTTESASLIGLLGMVAGLLMVLLGPLGGAVADRYPRRALLVLSDTLNGAAVAAVAAILFVSPRATGAALAAIIAASVLSAVTGSFFQPAISAAVPDLVPRERVPQAASLLQSSFQVATLLGRGIGGTLFQWLGAPIMFLINAISYWFAAAGESFIKMPPAVARRKGAAAFERDTIAGVRYVWNKPGLRTTVLGSSLLNFFTAPIMVLFPFFVEDFLKVGTGWYGYLLAAHGVGSLLGFASAGIARLNGPSRRRSVLLAMFAQSVGFGALAFVRSPVTALVLSFADGILVGFVGVSIISILQITTPSEFRGRVFGLIRSFAGAISPLGMGLAGIAADLLGKNIPLIYAACGAMMTLTALALLGSGSLREFLGQTIEPGAPPQQLEALS